jgi:hypothetical protein
MIEENLFAKVVFSCYPAQNFGAIAQLGERLHGMQEVVSSNLIGSSLRSPFVAGGRFIEIIFSGQPVIARNFGFVLPY